MAEKIGEEKKTVIQLDRSRTERAFNPDKNESLWNDEIDRMLNLIEKHVNALNPKNSDSRIDWEEQPLLSIGIFGSPGSGKSSLLRTFVKLARNENPGNDSAKKFANINSLPVFKLNTVVKDDHFLYAFLAAALKADREKNEDKDKQYTGSPILSRLQQKFQEVSEYLQVINKGEQSQDDDPLGMSLERLERHESGLILVEKMGEFIEELVDILVSKDKNSVVLLPVDDPDMSKGVQVSVLDTYQRYLQHPRLVPIFTFTGRLAEEQLQVDFEEKLCIKTDDEVREKFKETSTSLLITENMAIQYLGKLFPVRNRIRLGPAAARVLGAKYTPAKEEAEEENKEKDVLELLKGVSKLLFGHPVPYGHEIKASLRMITLRRQLQIVDAMQEAGIYGLEKKSKSYEKSWGQLFDLGTWTLLNTQRDVLKEINMYLDDLYSWTPKGLRRVVLDSILALDLKKRRKLITKWRYRTEGRRTQMLSLLAANVFRPRMEGEEPTGDDGSRVIKEWVTKEKRREKEQYKLYFPLRKGITWFLDICIGFYLPQIMACNFPDNFSKDKEQDELKKNNEDKMETTAESITGIGWDFESGPLHAIREALYNGDRFFSGMLFVDEKVINDIFEDIDSNAENRDIAFYTLLWCYYGYDGEKSWVAVSLWRALGLIGQLINYAQEKEEKNECIATEDIVAILSNHIKSSRVIGYPPKRFKGQGESQKFNTTKKVSDIPDTLAKSFSDWLNEIKIGKKGKHSEEKTITLNEPIFPLAGEDWETCFVRRLHGEYLLSDFWRNLENVYFDILPLKEGKSKSDRIKTIRTVIRGWGSVLGDYWADENSDNGKDVYWVRAVLMQCPIFEKLLRVKRGVKATGRKISQKKRLEVRKGVFDE